MTDGPLWIMVSHVQVSARFAQSETRRHTPTVVHTHNLTPFYTHTHTVIHMCFCCVQYICRVFRHLAYMSVCKPLILIHANDRYKQTTDTTHLPAFSTRMCRCTTMTKTNERLHEWDVCMSVCVYECVCVFEAVDECTLNTDNCDNAEAICTDTVGTFTCTCNDGWTTVDAGVTCTSECKDVQNASVQPVILCCCVCSRAIWLQF